MNRRGFSLMELIIVIALISTMLAIATINFNSWQVKYNIEAQVKEMLSDLVDVRSMAIASKKEHRVFLTPTSYSFRRYSSEADPKTSSGGVQVLNKTLKYQIAWPSSVPAMNPIVIDDRGYTTNLGTISVGVGLGDPAYNCIVVHTARVNMGKLNGTNCEIK